MTGIRSVLQKWHNTVIPLTGYEYKMTHNGNGRGKCFNASPARYLYSILYYYTNYIIDVAWNGLYHTVEKSKH